MDLRGYVLMTVERSNLPPELRLMMDNWPQARRS
jgi:hypothetical protein